MVLLLKVAAVAFSLRRPGRDDLIAFEIAVLIVEPDLVESPPPVVWSRLAIERELWFLLVEF